MIKFNKKQHLHHFLLVQFLITAEALQIQNTDNSEKYGPKLLKVLPKINSDDQNPAKNRIISNEDNVFEVRNVDEAVRYGLDTVENLLSVKEPLWFKMGLVLGKHHPASKVAEFGKPNKRALKLSHFGMATLEATRQIIQSFPGNISRQLGDFPIPLKSRILEKDCPLNGRPRCPLSSERYRTADGTCNNLVNQWKGASMLPMQRFLPPAYEDGIQSIRRSMLGTRLPSAREVSSKIHKDKDQELNVVTLMFMQWGQFIDHDISSTVKSRGFNGSVPRCCERSGKKSLPQDLLHPSCLPIEVPEDDWFFGKFGMGCMEFLRSAPSTIINCDLGWREQMNQATSFIDASMIYGNDLERADSIRTFRNGKILYGRPHGDRPLQPPDPPGGELCSAGALTTDCFQSGDGRVTEQPGLTALHTVWIRYHNKVATVLSRFNAHWTDEKVYQETRKIIYSLIQHFTYNEFLPILLGPEVMSLFELNLISKGFYKDYDSKANPMIANSFSTAAYRFGHSMVQNSFIRTDGRHRPIFNNVSLHDEFNNFENIWSFGSVDRTLLGFCNQPAQRRDEFICDELSNHLFQPTDMPFGMDLAAINVQRGRDHGIPPYTSWRQPCGLTPVKTWEDLKKIFSVETMKKFRKVYRHVDDIDLFSGGLAEKPVKGAVVGPTFACIIAQQFLLLRKGDRFWYENGDLPSSFTPAQLQQIRRATFSNILCQTMDEIETIQPFVFLAPKNSKNNRLSCKDPILKNFDLAPWIENDPNDKENGVFSREGLDYIEETLSDKKRRTKLQNRKRPDPTINTRHTVVIQTNKGPGNPLRKTTERPIEVNIKIQYYPSKPTKTTSSQVNTKRSPTGRPTSNYIDDKPVSYPIFIQSPNIQTTYNKPPSNKPTFTINRPTFTIGGPSSTIDNSEYGSYDYRPPQMFNRPTADSYNNPEVYRPSSYDYDPVVFEERPFVTSKKPTIYKPNTNHFLYNDVYVTKRPIQSNYDDDISEYFYKNKYEKDGGYGASDSSINVHSTAGYVYKLDPNKISDKLDFKSRFVNKNKDEGDDNKFVKISSIKSHASPSASSAIINAVLQREGDSDITEESEDVMRLVEMDVAPSDNDENNWLIYNESKKYAEKLDMPDVYSSIVCSEEVPQQLKKWEEVDED